MYPSELWDSFQHPKKAVSISNKHTSEVPLHTGRSLHFHPSQFTRPSFSIFRGSGSKTTTQRPRREHTTIFFHVNCLRICFVLESCGFATIWVVECSLLATTVLWWLPNWNHKICKQSQLSVAWACLLILKINKYILYIVWALPHAAARHNTITVSVVLV